MTIFCPSCGTRTEGSFCGSCGTDLREVARPATRPAAATSASASAATSARTPAPATVSNDVAPVPAGRSGGGTVPPWALALGVVLALALGALLAWLVLGDDEAAPAQGASPQSSPPVATSEPLPGSPAEPTSTTSTTTTDEGPTAVSSLPSGSWILVFASLEQDEHTVADAQRRADGISGDGRSATVVDSSAVPGLRPGFWAVAATGFTSQAEARAACADFGLELGGACYERQVR